MAPTKFINFLTLVSFAVFYVSLTPTAVNALAVERAHVARNLNYAHAGIAKKKRGSSKRCKTPPASSTPTPSSTPAYTPAAQPTTSSSPPPPTSSSTSSSYAPASTPASSSGMGQVLIDWSNGEQSSLCNFKTQYTTHVYNWQMNGYGDATPSSCGLTYIPMVWGPQDLGQVGSTLVAGYANMVMFYNEPDQPGQSNVDVGTAVGQFFQYIQPLASLGYEIVSPACTNSDDGFAWIQSFVSQVRQSGGQLNYIATHVYTNSYQDLISFMNGFLGAFPGDSIMLSEYACQDYSGQNNQCSSDQVETFVTQTNAYFLSQPSIVSHAYFGYFTQSELTANNVSPDNSLMNDDDSVNDLGNKIIYQATS